MNCTDAIEAALAKLAAHEEFYDDDHPWRNIDFFYGESVRDTTKLLYRKSGAGAIRLKQLLDVVEWECTEVFWPVFLSTWPNCVHIWPHRRAALQLLRQYSAQEHARNYMEYDARVFFDDLPPVVTAFRGCAHGRIRGISWTTDEKVARRFAGASLSKKNRVLATARIPKDSVFATCIDRGESEIIVDPGGFLRVWSVAVTPHKKGLLGF